MTEPEKIDLFKQFKAEYKAAAKPALVQTSPAQYLAVDGTGAPDGADFEQCIGALYGMAFTIKMTRKFAGLGDYTVCKLEAVWHAPAGKRFEDLTPDQWCWTLLIRTPDFITREDLDRAAAALRSKGKAERVGDVRLDTLDEGRCAQMLHVGPYDQLGESYMHLHAFAANQGLTPDGRPHDIYLSDPRRVDPAKLKTIVRLPVIPKGRPF